MEIIEDEIQFRRKIMAARTVMVLATTPGRWRVS
jgi:hypothetical protein